MKQACLVCECDPCDCHGASFHDMLVMSPAWQRSTFGDMFFCWLREPAPKVLINGDSINTLLFVMK